MPDTQPKALLNKFSGVRETRSQLGAADPTGLVVDEMISPTEALIRGRRTILMGTNNYLGLTFDPACIEAAERALRCAGTGTTGSRMANGNYATHQALEAALADFYSVPFAMIFSTGYAANIGTLAALLAPGDAVLLDSDAHASLFDGCRGTGADVYTFKHNDVSSLEKRLARVARETEAVLVVVEGLYSIMGDCAPLAEFVSVTHAAGAVLLVDEAHSLGVCGAHGRGVAEACNVLQKVDFITGTFSKSLGTTGGFCVSPHDALSLFPYASRPYMFTASPSPPTVASTHAALEAIRARPALREQLWRNANRLYARLVERNIPIGQTTPSPVAAVRFETREKALAAWQKLLDGGVYANLILPPAAPAGMSLLRFSVSAAHSDAQIDTVLDAIGGLSF